MAMAPSTWDRLVNSRVPTNRELEEMDRHAVEQAASDPERLCYIEEDNEMTHEPTPREEVLSEASGLITGDRNKTYGSPTENFRNTADIWNALLRHKLKPGEEITPTEVATLMVGLKLARTIAQPKRDNFVDMAGYAACGWETQAETVGDAA